MLGAIVGDVAGSTREGFPIKRKDFDLFEDHSAYTDDSVLTLAVAEAILDDVPFDETLRLQALANPMAGYGLTFWHWASQGDHKPYGSWSNGASMRVSACAWLADGLESALDLARRSAEVTHDHPEGVRGAQATAAAIYLARCGFPMDEIRGIVGTLSGYDLDTSVDEHRPTVRFELKSSVSVPQAIRCAIEAESFEDAVRNAISLGGDADTQAAIAGSIAEGAFAVPDDLAARCLPLLTPELRAILDRARAGILPPVRPTDATIAALPSWDPGCVARWNRISAGYNVDELERWEAMEARFTAPGRKSGSLVAMARAVGAGFSRLVGFSEAR